MKSGSDYTVYAGESGGMRHWFLFVLVACCMATPVLCAQSDLASQMDGKWKLNVGASSMHDLPPVKHATLEVKAKSHSFKWRENTEFEHGSSEMYFNGAVDGKPYRLHGSQPGTMISFAVNGESIDGTAIYPGGSQMHEKMTLSADRKTMTVECTMDGKSKPIHWIEVWE